MAIVTSITVLSLLLPPSYLGDPTTSRLAILQKSGMVTLFLALTSLILAIVTFSIYLAVIMPAVSALNRFQGISAQIGNVPWFVLPSLLLMLPALASVVSFLGHGV